MIIESSCHCGRVKLEIDGEAPAFLTSCNCSICRRTGGLYAYYPPANVKILTNSESTDEYIWGDRTLALVRCRTCGCISHWRSLDPRSGQVMIG